MDTITDKQREFAIVLGKQCRTVVGNLPEEDQPGINGMIDGAAAAFKKAETRAAMSGVIENLLLLRNDLWEAEKVANAAAKAEREDAPEGVHLLGEAVYKVQVAHHGSGRKYAKILDPATGEFEYAGRKPMVHLNDDTLMTYEQAAQHGHLYGMCVRCGRTLTDEASIARGIGPVCAEKFS